MPAPQGKLTNLPEIGAYAIAHALGLVWAVAANPVIFRGLLARGFHDLLAMGIAISVVVSIVVLMIFLVLRQLMAGGSFTDLPELAAYVIAHAVGLIWAYTVTPMLMRGLLAAGHRDLLMMTGIGHSIVVIAVVLLIFLFLRRLMARSGQSA
jgi:hypothetical protein